MGLVGFLDFVLKCIQLLAWPSFALGYPLCASIRAIETNSDFYIRKLVAYWISFSLISLFEYTFSILLEWVPVWPYVKILTICWLVIPGFNGAIIAYDNIVHPCLSMQLPQIIVDMLNKKQNVSLTRESFLEDAEKYVKENGTEALEKLFSSKPIIDEPPVAQKDIKAGEILDKRVEAAENKDSSGPAMLSGYSWRQKETVEKQQITTVDTDIKVNNTTLTEKLTENAFLAPPALKNVQKEWTCAVCQVTTQSEANLNSHLQGMKHRTKCDELKAGKQTSIKKGVSTGTPNKERNCAISQPIIDEPPVAQKDIKAVEILDKRVEAAENKVSLYVGSMLEILEKRVEAAGKQTAIKKGVSTGTPNKERNCAISQVTTQSKTTRTSLHQEFIEGKQTAIKNHSASTTIKSEQANRDLKNVSSDSGIKKVSCANQNPKQSSSGGGPNNKFDCDLCQVKLQSEATLKSHLQGTKHKSKSEQLKAREMTEKDKITSSTKYSDKNSSGLKKNLNAIAQVNIKANVSNGSHWCSICNVRCTSESDMASHLRGNRHLSMIKDSGHTRGVHYWCNICDVKCLSEKDMASHLNGKTHDSNLYESESD